MLSLSSLSEAFSFISALRGVAAMAGPPIAGVVVEWLGAPEVTQSSMTSSNINYQGCCLHVRGADGRVLAGVHPGLAHTQDTEKTSKLCRIIDN